MSDKTNLVLSLAGSLAFIRFLRSKFRKFWRSIIALSKTVLPRFKFLLVVLIFSVLPQTSLAIGDSVEGRKKAQACLTCHRKGNAVLGENTPIISGQYQDYLINALRDYRSGWRQHPVMNDLAATLSDQDIEDISAYYSGLKSRLSDPTQ